MLSRTAACALCLILICITAVQAQQLQIPDHLRDQINGQFGDALCLGPYRVSARDPAGDGSVCYWNCHDTTVPDPTSNTCVCAPNLVPAGSLGDGRLTCAHPGDPLSDRPEPYSASARDFLDLAASRGFGRQAIGVPNYQPCAVDSAGVVFTPEANNRDSRCVVTLLSGGRLADGWSIDALTVTAAAGRVEWFTNPGHIPMTLVVFGNHPEADVQVLFDQVVLTGPAGGHWSDALSR